MKETEDAESAFRVTMADGVRPLVKLNYLFGVSSYTLSPSGHLIHPYKTFSRIRVIFSLILISTSAVHTLYRMLETLVWSPIYHSEGIARFNKMVELVCQFVSNMNPLMLVLIGLFKVNALHKFFNEMGTYNVGISKFADPARVRIVSRRFLFMHLFMILISGVLLIVRVFTTIDPSEVWMTKMFTQTEYGNLLKIVNTLMIAAFVVMKHSAIAFIEVFSIALATCFCRVISNLKRFILEEADKWDGKYFGCAEKLLCENESRIATDIGNYRKEKLYYGDSLDHPHYQRSSSSSSQQELVLLPKLQTDKENNVAIQIDPALHQGTTRMTPGQQICYVIRKVERVAKMQNVVNGLFGPIIALDIGFTVVMLVLLKYLLIRNMGSHLARLRRFYADFTSNEGKSDQLILQSNSTYTTPKIDEMGLEGYDLFISSPYGWLFFLGFDICFTIRLVVITKCLSNVYNASVKFNCALSKVLGMAQRLVDLEEQKERLGMNCEIGKNDEDDKDDKRKPFITPTEATTVLTFVTTNSSAPIAFSAGGLFTFSGSTILLISSIVISYVVFLLQA